MNLLDEWFCAIPFGNVAPLFDEINGEIPIFVRGSMRKLRRHPAFDELMIQKIERGLQNPDWTGLVYVMHWCDAGEVVPLYVGKAERKGIKNELSFNIARIRTNQHAFGRWGYGLAYHIGDLSHAVLGGVGYKKPDRKYLRWAERLLVKQEPPTLRRTVYVALIDWYTNMCGPSGLPCSIASGEKELIALAGAHYSGTLLNTDGC